MSSQRLPAPGESASSFPACRQPGSSLRFHGALCPAPCSSPFSAVIISPCLLRGLPGACHPAAGGPQVGSLQPDRRVDHRLSLPRPAARRPIPSVRYPASRGVSPPSSVRHLIQDHSGSESPISDEEERLQSKLSDFWMPSKEKFQCNLCNKTYSTFSGLGNTGSCTVTPSPGNPSAVSTVTRNTWSLGALKMHIRTHTLPCVCKICARRSPDPGYCK